MKQYAWYLKEDLLPMVSNVIIIKLGQTEFIHPSGAFCNTTIVYGWVMKMNPVLKISNMSRRSCRQFDTRVSLFLYILYFNYPHFSIL